MSSTPVVLHAGLNDQSRHMQLRETKKTEGSDALFEVKYKHDNAVTILDTYHICYNVISEKHQSTSYPLQNIQNTAS